MKYVFRKKWLSTVMSAADAAGYAVFGAFGRRPAPSSIERILLVRLDHIGDTLLMSGLPKLIKESYPGSKLYFLTAAWGRPLLERNPFIDEIVVYNAPWYSRRHYRRSGDDLRMAGLVRKLRAMKIDTAIAPRGDLRENALLFLSGIPNRLGYGITGGGFFLTKEGVYRPELHESEQAMALVSALGIHAPFPKPSVYLTDDERAAFAGRLKEWGMAPGERTAVGFQIDAGTAAKAWPLSHQRVFHQLFLKRFPGRRIVFVGSDPSWPMELPRSERILDLTGKTTVRELCLLMEHLAAFVGTDSGPTHLASAMGVPSVFLYSGTNVLSRWRPLDERAAALKHDVPCAPCSLKECPVPGHPCMTGITPEDAVAALETKLA